MIVIVYGNQLLIYVRLLAVNNRKVVISAQYLKMFLIVINIIDVNTNIVKKDLVMIMVIKCVRT